MRHSLPLIVVVTASINIHTTVNDNASDNVSANTKIDTAVIFYANDDNSVNENVNTTINNGANDSYYSDIIDIKSTSLRLHPISTLITSRYIQDRLISFL